MSVIDTVNRMLAPLSNRVRLMVARGVLRAVADSPKLQELQAELLAGELRDKLERFQNYGITSHPFPGAETVVVFPGGNRDHGLVIAVDDRRYRLTSLEPGEVALYDDQGQTIIIKRDGITVHTDKLFRVEADVIELHAESRFQFDVNGHGQQWFPTYIDTWQIGETPGTAYTISPPEVG